MHAYLILWTYIGNYADRPVVSSGSGPLTAVHIAFNGYNDHFKDNATFHVFSASLPGRYVRIRDAFGADPVYTTVKIS